jgi:hypothetical protein
VTAAGRAAVLALAVSLAAAPSARAEGRPSRVLLVTPGPADPTTTRLVDELFAAGIAVEIVPGSADDAATLAAKFGADAVLRVQPGARGVVVWVTPLDPGEPAEQHLAPGAGASADRPADLALRAVEAVRGRLLRVTRARREREASAPAAPPPSASASPTASPAAPASAAPRGPDSPPSTPAPRAAAPLRRIALYIGPAITASPGGGIGPGGSILTGVRFLSGHFGADACALVSVAPAVVSADGGRVKLSGTAIGVGGWVDAFEPGAPLALGAGLGIAGAFIAYEAQATSPAFVGQSGMVGYSLPYLRAALEWRAMRHLALRLDGLAGIAAPRPVVAVGPDTVAYFGRPLVAAGFAVEMTVP